MDRLLNRYADKTLRKKVRLINHILTALSFLLLGVNFLLYSFFKVEFSRDIARVVAMELMVIDVLFLRYCGKEFDFSHVLLFAFGAALFFLPSQSSANIGFLLMMSALLLMAESNVKEVAFFCMAALIALVIFSLVCGFVTFNTDLSGGRVRYTLGFSNVNAASVFFMSLVFCYMVAVKPDLLDMIPVAGFIVLLFLITDTRSMIFGGALLVAAYCAFYLLKKKRKAYKALSYIVLGAEILFFFSPFILTVFHDFFMQFNELFSSRIKINYEYLLGHTFWNFLFGGSNRGEIDYFYEVLLLNCGAFVYAGVGALSVWRTYALLRAKEIEKAVFIFAVLCTELVEGNLLRPELLFVIVFWFIVFDYKKPCGMLSKEFADQRLK